MSTKVTLEKCGRNHGYKGLDNSSFCPDSQCCIVGGPDCINSVIDMDSVCKRVTASGLGVAVSVSQDAGRWFILSCFPFICFSFYLKSTFCFVFCIGTTRFISWEETAVHVTVLLMALSPSCCYTNHSLTDDCFQTPFSSYCFECDDWDFFRWIIFWSDFFLLQLLL